MCAFTKVPESVKGVPFQLRLDDLRAFTCIQCRVPRFNFRVSDRGRTVPRIGVCRAYHGSGCAVPRIGVCRAADRGVPCRGSGCAVPTTDRDVPCLPRIEMCRAYHGSGCAVPTTDRGVPCLPRIGVCRARGTLHLGARYSTGSKKLGRPQH